MDKPTSNAGRAPRFLARPEIEVLLDEGGLIDAVYVRVQDRSVKAVRTVQPNAGVMVDFYLDRNDWPVGIALHEPVEGVAFTKTVRRILEPGDGSASERRSHYFFTKDEEAVAFVLDAFLEGRRRMEQGGTRGLTAAPAASPVPT